MQYFGKTKKLICQPFHVVVVPKFKAFEVNACNFPLLLIFEFRFRLTLLNWFDSQASKLERIIFSERK